MLKSTEITEKGGEALLCSVRLLLLLNETEEMRVGEGEINNLDSNAVLLGLQQQMDRLGDLDSCRTRLRAT